MKAYNISVHTFLNPRACGETNIKPQATITTDLHPVHNNSYIFLVLFLFFYIDVQIIYAMYTC